MTSFEGPRTLPYLLIELANSHGGDLRVLEDTIARYAAIPYAQKGLKFQAFAPDMIALPDFSHHELYRRLAFDLDTWTRLVGLAQERGDVWLDIFDSFGVTVLEHNRHAIRGIKLQPSVLENLEVRDALQRVGIADKEVILNVSGLAMPVIEDLVGQFRALSNQLFLQVGFQAYPTKIEDTGLGKLRALRDADLGCRFALADHADGSTLFAQVAPVLGFILGCELVEKHFVLDRAEAEFDSFSALEPDDMHAAAQLLLDAYAATSGPFINTQEAEYLTSTIQKPVARRPFRSGDLVATSDLLFRRTSQEGMSLADIRSLQSERKVLGGALTAHQVFTRENFRPARVGTLVAGRLKSTRLTKKALLPIGGMPSVERCLMQCASISTSEKTILATSTLDEDTELASLTFQRVDGGVEVWRGDPTDVIDRYLGAARAFGLDVIIRVTADCPFVLPDIAGLLVNEHFAAGADYTSAREFAVGTAVEIINVAALERVQEHFGRCNHAEYMTWYFQNNRNVFKVNIVDLPRELVRDYRVTLDYPEDLAMFEALVPLLPTPDRAILATELFGTLDSNPGIAAINAGLPLRYRVDAQLIETLNQETRILPESDF